MKKYQAVPYRLYEDSEGETVHFNEETLSLTILPLTYVGVLRTFSQRRSIEETVELFSPEQNTREIIHELIELGILSETFSLPLLQETVLRPHVQAFRIVLTEKCNLRCAECFVTKNAGELRTMSPETLERIIRETIPYGLHQKIVYHFFGGEPLLRFDYITRAIVLVEEAIATGKMQRPVYTITTNATLVSEEIIAFFKKHRFKVGVSIDGPQDINDKLRVYGSGAGTYQDVKQNYTRLVEAGIDCHILITPHPRFLDRLPDIFRSVLETFPMETVTVNTPLHFDTVQWTAPGKEYAKTLIKLHRIAKEFGVHVDSAASPPLAALAGNIRREGPCALICDTVMASVGPDGSMSFCSQKWHPFLTVPSVGDKKLQTPLRRATDCVTCEARGVCGGPCPAFQRISGNMLDGNKCDFMHTLLSEAVRNLDLFEEGQ